MFFIVFVPLHRVFDETLLRQRVNKFCKFIVFVPTTNPNLAHNGNHKIRGFTSDSSFFLKIGVLDSIPCDSAPGPPEPPGTAE